MWLFNVLRTISLIVSNIIIIFSFLFFQNEQQSKSVVSLCDPDGPLVQILIRRPPVKPLQWNAALKGHPINSSSFEM